MRVLIDSALSGEDRAALSEFGSRRHHNFAAHPVIRKLVGLISEKAPILASAPSYWCVEKNPAGHEPHYDGCRPDKDGALENNHMPWCQYSTVSLLSDPDDFEGGVFSFYDPDESHKEDLVGSLLLYSSGIDNDPQKHGASPHSNGSRAVLLMFFATEGSRDL